MLTISHQQSTIASSCLFTCYRVEWGYSTRFADEFLSSLERLNWDHEICYRRIPECGSEAIEFDRYTSYTKNENSKKVRHSSFAF